MPIPTLLYTDLGSDVDDLEAVTLAYAEQNRGNLNIRGVVTSHMIPHQRARMVKDIFRKFESPVAIAEGSAYRLGGHGDTTEWHAYLYDSVDHKNTGTRIRLDQLPTTSSDVFRDPTELLYSSLEEAKGELHIAVLGPLTDLAKSIMHDLSFVRHQLKGITIMGHGAMEDGRLIAKPRKSYNFRADPWAADIVLDKLQDDVNFTIVNKHAAYSAPLLREDFWDFARTGHPIGEDLLQNAELCLRAFAESAPKLYQRLYHLKEFDPHIPLHGLQNYSYPYDPTVIAAMVRPDLLTASTHGRHTLMGKGRLQQEKAGALHSYIKNGILEVLSSTTGASVI